MNPISSLHTNAGAAWERAQMADGSVPVIAEAELSSNAAWDAATIARDLWKNQSAVISDEMVKKVNIAHIYLQKIGFVLGGIEANGNCFLKAFLKSYETLTKIIPLLDVENNDNNRISFLRSHIAAQYTKNSSKESNHHVRANQIIQEREWVTADGEGVLLANADALSIPIRTLTVGTSDVSDMLVVSEKKEKKEEKSLTWELIPEQDRPKDYIFIIDLGGHFLYAKPLIIAELEEPAIQNMNPSKGETSMIPQHTPLYPTDSSIRSSHPPSRPGEEEIRPRGPQRGLSPTSGFSNIDPNQKRNFLGLLRGTHQTQVEELSPTLQNRLNETMNSVFERQLKMLQTPSPETTCFICFNFDEDRKTIAWLDDALAPDLRKIGVTPLYSREDLKTGHSLNNFEAQAGTTTYAVIIATRALNDKRKEYPESGVAIEIGYMKKRPINTTIPIYLDPYEKESNPLDEEILSVTNVRDNYANILNLFATLLGPNQRRRAVNDYIKEIHNIGRRSLEWLSARSEGFTNLIDSGTFQVDPLSHALRIAPIKQGVPQENQFFVQRQTINLEKLFNENKIIVLTQSPDDICRTGKTQIAIDYANSTFEYKQILWIKTSMADFDNSKLDDLKTLIVFDNVSPEGILEMSLLLQKSNSQVHILITSRHIQWDTQQEGIEVIEVPTFSSNETEEFIKKIKTDHTESEINPEFIKGLEGVPSLVEATVDEINEFGTDTASYYLVLEYKHELLAKKGNIPSPNKVFGRAQEIEYCNQWFLNHRDTLYITGAEGIGKTTLAQQFALLNVTKYESLRYLSWQSDPRINETKLSEEAKHSSRTKKSLLILDNVPNDVIIPEINADLIVITSSPSKTSLQLGPLKGLAAAALLNDLAKQNCSNQFPDLINPFQITLVGKWIGQGLSPEHAKDCLKNGNPAFTQHLFPLIKTKLEKRLTPDQSRGILSLLDGLILKKSLSQLEALNFVNEGVSSPQAEEVLNLAVPILNLFFPIKRSADGSIELQMKEVQS